MKAGEKFSKQLNRAGKQLAGTRKSLGKLGRRAVAGAAGAALLVGNLGKSIKGTASDIRDHAFAKQNHSGEVTMKKSTLIALLVALAAVAGVLGALYFYVLRREKELDEYEQLLFSEDFNDDLPDNLPEEPAGDKA